MSAVLAVWLDGIRAAELHADSGAGFRLRYLPDWLHNPQCYPLSPHLPLGAESSGAEVKNFFANLLPEGAALEVAASMHNLSKHDAFGLLARIGREVAGAMAILPENGRPDAPDVQNLLRPIGMTELSQRIQARPATPFSAWDGKIRLSIAGHQDKLALYIDIDGVDRQESAKMYLPDGGASSTHILKPENLNPKFPFMPANEYFCMRLAAALKLIVPRVALWHIPAALYLIARFDRKRAQHGQTLGRTPAVTRVHQIDLCQILNLPVDMKYQQAYEFSPEGASHADLFRAADSVTQPAACKKALLSWIVFNYLIGNTDAHAKNLSFFLDHNGLRMAPFYDLLSGTIYGLKDLALFIGREEEIGLVSASDWMELCKKNALHPAVLAAELKAQAKAWHKCVPKLLQEIVYTSDERAFLAGLVKDMKGRAELMQEQSTLLAGMR